MRPRDQPAQDYLQFWGKAGGELPGEPTSWHPVAYHCLDVAAVADVLLRANPRRLAALARLLGTTPDATRNLLVALIALHDVGKFAAPFQAKCPDVYYPPCLARWTGSTAVRHDEVGSEIRELLRLQEQFAPGWSPGDFDDLWHAVTGHHGKPRIVGVPPINPTRMPPQCRSAASAFVRDVAALFSCEALTARPKVRELALLSWAVVGLTVTADWIGSNRTWFPYGNPETSLSAYWQEALGKAEEAVALAGILPAALPADLTAAHLLPDIAASLSPLQVMVQTTALPDGPMLAIVEDVTGSGKTEAALLLAARLLQSGRGDGLFFALPTMATANAMFDRLGESYRRLYSDDATPSLVLAHGKRALNQGFTDSILGNADTKARAADGYDDGGGAACAAWIADDRRKAFLAHVGVGTIDQALLSVLPSKYQSLRLWGLCDRVLVIDEAHAYDAYMSKEIETLLEFHAALGGSAIILSATLAAAQRRALTAAYAKGLGGSVRTASSDDYPLLTVVGVDQCAVHSIASDRKRSLPVRRIARIDEAVAHVEAIAREKAAVAWIRNSVDDAIEAVELLQARGLSPVLLHARFAMGDRLDIERDVTQTLGREDKTGKRAGFVLVGTQILEQSLDYDVDGMIVDLAPIDLMIQRAGRLWRHIRRGDRPVAEPELLVLSPDPDPAQVQDRDWYRTISKRGAAVYDHHGIVWRSAKVLFGVGRIETPGGVRDLIEQVYASKELDDIPEPLHAQSKKAEGERSAARSFANTNLLNLDDGYAGCSALWTQDTVTPTRLGQPVTVFRLGKIHSGRVVPWYQSEDDDPCRSWALSEVSLAQYRANGVPEPDAKRAAIVAAAKADWPEWEREQPLLILEPDADGWRGVVTKTGDGEKQVSYHKRVGLRIVEA